MVNNNSRSQADKPSSPTIVGWENGGGAFGLHKGRWRGVGERGVMNETCVRLRARAATHRRSGEKKIRLISWRDFPHRLLTHTQHTLSRGRAGATRPAKLWHQQGCGIAARRRHRCLSFGLHITWICGTFTSVEFNWSSAKRAE